jgi:hypothetical protein
MYAQKVSASFYWIPRRCRSNSVFFNENEDFTPHLTFIEVGVDKWELFCFIFSTLILLSLFVETRSYNSK